MKLMYLKQYDVTPFTATLTSGVDTNGQPLFLATVTGKCRFNERHKTLRKPDGQFTDSLGVITVEGDLLSTAAQLEGSVIVGNSEMKILAAFRPRNPDGTVHHTRLELG